MAKKLAFDPDAAVARMKKYFIDDCRSDPKKLTIKLVTEDLNKNGFPQIGSETVKHNARLKEARNDLLKLGQAVSMDKDPPAPTYKPVDVDRVFQGVSDKHKERIRDIDKDRELLAVQYAQAKRQYDEVHAALDQKTKEYEALRVKVTALEKVLEHEKENYDRVKNFIRATLNVEMAKSLLAECGEPFAPSKDLNENALGEGVLKASDKKFKFSITQKMQAGLEE